MGFNVTVVGLGLIGGSFSLALRELKPKNIWGVDIDQGVLEKAEKKGIVDKGFVNPSIPLQDSDLVIICLYPELTVKFMRDNIFSFKSGAIITDTSGIKNKVIDDIQSFLPDNLDFVSGHPLAGREYKGLDLASKEIFRGANYIITPTKKNIEENIVFVEEMLRKMGCEKVTRVKAEEHDKIIAFTSQLPHIIASAMINSVENENVLDFMGGSFKDMTRVARVNVPLWTELLIENRENILGKIDIFEKNITLLKNAINNRDEEELSYLLEKGCEGRGKLS
ncbi:MAG: prephenate dehydrogenase [Eubacteriales bacterium]